MCLRLTVPYDGTLRSEELTYIRQTLKIKYFELWIRYPSIKKCLDWLKFWFVIPGWDITDLHTANHPESETLNIRFAHSLMALRVSLKFSMLGTRCRISSVTLQPENNGNYFSNVPDMTTHTQKDIKMIKINSTIVKHISDVNIHVILDVTTTSLHKLHGWWVLDQAPTAFYSWRESHTYH